MYSSSSTHIQYCHSFRNMCNIIYLISIIVKVFLSIFVIKRLCCLRVFNYHYILIIVCCNSSLWDYHQELLSLTPLPYKFILFLLVSGINHILVIICCVSIHTANYIFGNYGILRLSIRRPFAI